MGWDFGPKPPGMKPVDIIRAQCFPKRFLDSLGAELVAQGEAGSAAYFALKKLARDMERDVYVIAPDGSVTIGLVYLFESRGGSFGFKQITETMGPAESNCPAEVLDKLSPLKSDGDGWAASKGSGWCPLRSAAAWRERCRSNLKSAA